MDQTTFLHHLRRSKLLSAEQLHQIAERPAPDSALALASGLVAEGLLTHYQAEQLLAGNAKGFLLGQYRILDYLGQGSMGAVFQAVHTAMERLVAVKVFRRDAFDSEDARQSYLREVRAAGQLNHPHIVTAYDANKARGVHFLVMEYVDGPSLSRLVHKAGPLPVGLACELIRQAADALGYAQQHGFVHRDIKPSNLLVRHAPGWSSPRSPAGRRPPAAAVQKPFLKVLDFGLARLGRGAADAEAVEASQALKSGVVYGTPDYISPEQAEDVHAVDIRSDLYSLGCTFYFALTGRVPFPGSTALEKLVKHLTEQPEPLKVRRPEVPAGLAAVVERLMARDPADRFQTPAELAAALAPWCGEARGPAATPTRYALNTPSETDLEPGTGWLLDDSAVDGQPVPSAPPPGRRRRRALSREAKRGLLWSAYAGLGLAVALLALLYLTTR
jgi:serine/threonine-protein kinase